MDNVPEDRNPSTQSSNGHHAAKDGWMKIRALLSSPYARGVGRILLVGAGLLMGLCLAEFGLRIVGYEGDHERKNTVYHDDYGQLLEDAWVLSAVFDSSRSDHVDVNGQIVNFKKRAGRTRVVFVGDSGTWGKGVKRYEAFPLVFGTLAKFLGVPDLEVVNAAVSGMTNVTEYRLLADQLMTLQPDIVVLGLFMANDINFNLDDQHLLGEAPSAWRTLGLRLREISALAHFAYLQLLVHNAKFRFLREPDEPLAEVSSINLVDSSGFHMLDYTQGEISTYKKQYSPLTEYAFDLLKDILWRCKTLGEKEDFQFAVVFVPTSSQVADELQIFTAPEALAELRDSGIDIDESELDVKKSLEVVKEICAELEIVCIDPTLDLHRIGATEAIFSNDDHLSPKGHQILAISLAKHFDNEARRFLH